MKQSSESPQSNKKEYKTPELKIYGSLTDLTKGGTFGGGEGTGGPGGGNDDHRT